MSSFMTPGIRHGLRMLRRDRSYGALLATLTGTIFLFHLLSIVALGVAGAENSLSRATDMRVSLMRSAGDDQVLNFFTALKKQPFVESAVYITREQAYEAQRQSNPSLIALIERSGLGNPFRDTVAIRLASSDQAPALQTYLRSAEWADVIDPAFLSTIGEQETRTAELLAGARAVGFLSKALLFLALAVIVFVLVMEFDARSELRDEEVTVSRLLGARKFDVLLPFITEATVLLLLASVLSVCVLGLIVMLLPLVLPGVMIGSSLSPVWTAMTNGLFAIAPIAILLHLVLAPFLAWAGVKIGVRFTPLALS